MTAYSERPRDLLYLEWVRQQPCLLRRLGDCDGAVEADHAGERPYGQKCDDGRALPLCRKHHRDRTDSRGFFRAPDREAQFARRLWIDRAIAATRRLWETRRLGAAGGIPF